MLTADTVEDNHPDVASRAEGHVVAWSRQPRGKSERVQDVFSASYDGSWSDPAPVTDNEFLDLHTSVAHSETTGETLVVWTRVTRDLRGEPDPDPREYAADTEVFYAVHDGFSWSEPTRLSSGDGIDMMPQVAEQDGTFLVAWGGNPGEDITSGNTYVRHALYRDGRTSDVSEFPAPRVPPTVAPGGDEEFRMSYFSPDPNSQRDGSVVVVEGLERFEEVDRYRVSGYRGSDVGRDGVAWARSGNEETVVEYARGGEVEAVPSRLNTSAIGGISLTDTDRFALMTYRGFPEAAGHARPIYQVRHEGEWVHERDLNHTGTDRLVFSADTTATGEESFATTYIGREAGQQLQNRDLFALVHEYRPDLTVEANVTDEDDIEAGDAVTVEYDARNVGERDLDGAFEVALVGDGERLATATHDPLGIGERVSGSFEADVPATGRLSVVVDPGGDHDELSVENNGSTVVAARPDVGVTGFDVAREGSDATLTATIENVGGADATDVDVIFENADGTIDRRSIARLDRGDSRQVEFETTIERLQEETVRIKLDAAGDDNRDNDVVYFPGLRPDVVVLGSGVEFENREGQLVAEVTVLNTGPVPAEFDLSVIDEDETELASTNVSLDAATRSGTAASRQVTFELPPRVSGRMVTVVADVEDDDTPGDNAARVQVPSFEDLDITAPTIENFTAEVSDDGETVEVVVVADEMLDTEGLRVSVGGQESGELTGEDFEESGVGFRYVARVPAEESGPYEFELTAAPDPAGNDGAAGQTASVTVEESSDGGMPGMGVGVALVALALALVALLARRRR